MAKMGGQSAGIALVGALFLVLGIGQFLAYIPGIALAGNCSNIGSTLAITPTTVGENQNFQASGQVYPPISFTCTLVGSPVYLWYLDPTTNQYHTFSTISNSQNGVYSTPLLAPSDYIGTLTIFASVCPRTNQQCYSGVSEQNGQASLTVTQQAQVTHSAYITFQANGAPVSGVLTTIDQGSQQVDVQTSNQNGLVAFFMELVPGTTYTVYYQPTVYNGGQFTFTVGSSDFSTTINLSPLCSGTTTATQTTTIYLQVYCSTSTTTTTISSTTSSGGGGGGSSCPPISSASAFCAFGFSIPFLPANLYGIPTGFFLASAGIILILSGRKKLGI